MNRFLFSIVVVNWNSCDMLQNCLNSISETNPNGKYEIIVVDNASSDNSIGMVKKEFPEVILIENQENFGFAKATNIGIKTSRGDIILLLNSDAELKTPNTFEKIEKFFAQHDDIGILGVNLIFPDGVPQSPGGKFISIWQLFKYQILFLSSPLFYHIKNKFFHRKYKQFYDIDYVSGACLFVRRKVVDDIGLLNENFYMYGEDMEFCYRAKQSCWRRVILLSINVIHLKGQSTKKNLEGILIHSIKNNCQFIKMLHGRKSFFIAHVIYMLGLFLRFILAFIRKNESPVSYLKLMLQNCKLCFS